MAEYQAMTPGMEVDGLVISAFKSGFPKEVEYVGVGILEKYGIGNPTPGTWYSVQAYYDAMKEISERYSPAIITRIGEEVVTKAQFPPFVNSLEQALAVGEMVYKTYVRGGEYGNIKVENLGTEYGIKRMRVTFHSGAPCAYDRGMLMGGGRRFMPEGMVDVVVRHDETQPCKSKGGDTCTFIVSWT